MKESYGEGLATHTGSESCATARKGRDEVLTGVRAGRVFSRESTFLRGADAIGVSGRPYSVHRNRKVCWSPARSETPSTFGNTSHENREIPCSPWTSGVPGRIGKSKDVRR